MIGAAYEVYLGAAEAHFVAVQIDVPEDVELPLERVRIERVFLKLIDNALGAMPGGGRLSISAEVSPRAVVRVQDSEPGISPQIRQPVISALCHRGKRKMAWD